MRYIIPLVNGSYTEGDSAIVTEGTRNDSSTHKFIVAVNGAPQGGKITIQYKSPGRSNWSEVDYTFLSEVNPQTIEYTGEISQYRFIVQDVSGSGSVVISDTEEGEAITPFGMFGATGGMTPGEIGGSIVSRGLFNLTRGDTEAATITMGSAGGGSVITDSFRVYPALKEGTPNPDSDPSFDYNGVLNDSLTAEGSDTVHGKLFTGATPSSKTGFWQPSVSFDYAGSEFEVQLRSPSTSDGYYRVFANSKPINEFQSFSGSAGSSYKLHVDFGGYALRNIEIRFYGCDFGGVWCEPSYRPIKPARYAKPTAVFISNSICAGYSTETSRWSSWPAAFCDSAGLNMVNASIGGTGYIAEPTYIERLDDLNGLTPDIVFFGDHYNDLSSAASEIKAAIQLAYTAIKSKWPNAHIFIINGWSVDESLSERQIEVADYVRDFATSNGLGIVDYTDTAKVFSITDEWATGVNYVQGDTVAYDGVIYECYADHTSSGAINLSGFRPAKIINSASKSTLLLSDEIHPSNETSALFGNAFIRSVS